MNRKLSDYTLAMLLLLSTASLAQDKKSPTNVEQAVAYLELETSDSLKAVIKMTQPNDLNNLVYPTGQNLKSLFYWLYGDDTNKKLIKYIKKGGVVNYQRELILTVLRNRFLANMISEEQVFNSFRERERKLKAENAVRYTTDTLNGIYIPKDLDDCFAKINSFWPDSTKSEVKKWTESDFTAKTHFGLGMWMRNNWGLWAGSRLSVYFNKLGINHPDDMSGMILTSYHRYLNNKKP